VNEPRGRFIVLEGIDGSGTTTQAHALVGALEAQGRRALYTREPSDGPIGLYIRTILRGEVEHSSGERTIAALFAADRLDHWDREIEPALSQGIDVVCDRYVLSSLAYQGVMTGDEAWILALNAHARDADVTVLLELSPTQASRRRQLRGEAQERYEPDATQIRVASAYGRLAGHVAAHRLDGDRSVEAVTADLLSVLREAL